MTVKSIAQYFKSPKCLLASGVLDCWGELGLLVEALQIANQLSSAARRAGKLPVAGLTKISLKQIRGGINRTTRLPAMRWKRTFNPANRRACQC